MTNAVVEWLNEQQTAMVELLSDIVNIDSNSFDKAGVDKVADRLRLFFDDHGIQHDTISVETHGDALRAVVAGGNGNQPRLLCFHCRRARQSLY